MSRLLLCGFMIVALAAGVIAEPISLRLDYAANTPWDIDNDGHEQLDGVVDLTMAGSTIDSSLHESYLCSLWTVHSLDRESSTELCYGSDECCSFVGLKPVSNQWNNPLLLSIDRYGATKNNRVMGQLVYAEMKVLDSVLVPTLLYSEILSKEVLFGNDDVISPDTLDITISHPPQSADKKESTLIITHFGRTSLNWLTAKVECDNKEPITTVIETMLPGTQTTLIVPSYTQTCTLSLNDQIVHGGYQ